jgi:hypothetical protein
LENEKAGLTMMGFSYASITLKSQKKSYALFVRFAVGRRVGAQRAFFVREKRSTIQVMQILTVLGRAHSIDFNK